MRKNPRLASVLKADETTVSNKSATQFPPGLSASMSGASALLASTGIPSLDICLGGGLPAASILTVFEDVPASKANFAWTGIVRCFLAETLATSANDLTRKDSGWIGIVGHEITGILDTLPRPEAEPVETSDKRAKSSTSPDFASNNPDMKIAWRYQGLKEFDSNLKKVDSVLLLPGERTLGHTFDLGRKYDKLPSQLQDRTVMLDLATPIDSMESCHCPYKRTWTLFSESVRANQKFGLGRFVIGSLAAPGFWNCTCGPESSSSCDPSWLLLKISNLIQEMEASHPCLVLVTIPVAYLSSSSIFETTQSQSQSQSSSSRVIQVPSWLPAVENVSDAVIELKPLVSIT